MSVLLIDLRSDFFYVSWCFTTFYSVLFVYSYLCYVELSACPFYCGIRVTQKTHFLFYAFIMNNKVLFYLYLYTCNTKNHTKLSIFWSAETYVHTLPGVLQQFSARVSNLIFFYPLTFNYRMNSVFYSRETALRESGSEDSLLLLLYTAQTTHPSWPCFCSVFLWEPLHKMASHLCIYRARIGCFYNIAVSIF